MGFVHTFAHFFVFFRIFSLFFQTCFYENVYVVMGSAKKIRADQTDSHRI